MLDFYLLSIIGIGLLGGVTTLLLTRKILRNAAMDKNARKAVMGLDEKRSGDR